MSEFHLRDGFYFRRNDDGSVTIRYEQPLLDPMAHLGRPPIMVETTVPAAEWDSVQNHLKVEEE